MRRDALFTHTYRPYDHTKVAAWSLIAIVTAAFWIAVLILVESL